MLDISTNFPTSEVTVDKWTHFNVEKCFNASNEYAQPNQMISCDMNNHSHKRCTLQDEVGPGVNSSHLQHEVVGSSCAPFLKPKLL